MLVGFTLEMAICSLLLRFVDMPLSELSVNEMYDRHAFLAIDSPLDESLLKSIFRLPDCLRPLPFVEPQE